MGGAGPLSSLHCEKISHLFATIPLCGVGHIPPARGSLRRRWWRATVAAMPQLLYAGLHLDRGHLLRRDEAALTARLAAPETRLVPMWQGRCLVDEGLRLVSLANEPGVRAAATAEAFLGLDGGTAWLAVDLPGETEPTVAPGTRFESLRSLGPTLPPGEAALAAYAKGILYWHARHGYCGVCGAPTLPQAGGHVRRCIAEACAAEHFPRTDPAIIVLVHDGDRALLHRQPHWPEGMWSVLAGFVEPGESLEEAVAREMAEEAGVRVDSVTYRASQPWPFPASLMVGFTARYAGGAVVIDRHELDDARWFTKAEIAAFDGTTRFLPRKDSIARWLVDEWMPNPLP